MPHTRKLTAGSVSSLLLVDNGDIDESEFLHGEIRTKDELARGSMKQVFEVQAIWIYYVK